MLYDRLVEEFGEDRAEVIFDMIDDDRADAARCLAAELVEMDAWDYIEGGEIEADQAEDYSSAAIDDYLQRWQDGEGDAGDDAEGMF